MGPSSPVLIPAVGADQNDRPIGSFRNRLPGLIADGVQACGDMTEGSNEGGIRRTDADVAAEAGQAGEDACHGVFTYTADRKGAREGIGHAVEIPFRKAFGSGAHARGPEQVCRGDENSALARFVVVLQDAAQFASEGCRLTRHQLDGFRDLLPFLFSRPVNRVDLGRVLSRLSLLAVQSVTRLHQSALPWP